MARYNLAVADIYASSPKCHVCRREFECQSMIRLVLDPPQLEPIQSNQFVLCPSCAQFLSTCITTAMLNIINYGGR